MIIWRTLDWLNSNYEVCNSGVVRNKARKNVLKPNVSNSGYLQVRISINGKFTWFYIHRLVLIAFTRQNLTQINHIDGNKIHNNLDNLEWSTASHNKKHAYESLGLENHNKKKIAQITVDGQIVKVWGSFTDAVNEGYNRRCMWLVCNGKQRHHKNFKWQYV